MSLPLPLAEQIRRGKRKAIQINSLSECKDDLIYIRDYRTFEYYKRINNKFVYARNLLPREVDDFHFNNGNSFRGCTVVERLV